MVKDDSSLSLVARRNISMSLLVTFFLFFPSLNKVCRHKKELYNTRDEVKFLAKRELCETSSLHIMLKGGCELLNHSCHLFLAYIFTSFETREKNLTLNLLFLFILLFHFSFIHIVKCIFYIYFYYTFMIS